MLKISGLPCFASASSNVSMQKRCFHRWEQGRTASRGDADGLHGDRGALSASAHDEARTEPQGLSVAFLRGVEITRPNQVWAMDITYIPMVKGFVSLGRRARLVQPPYLVVARVDYGIARSTVYYLPRSSVGGRPRPHAPNRQAASGVPSQGRGCCAVYWLSSPQSAIPYRLGFFRAGTSVSAASSASSGLFSVQPINSSARLTNKACVASVTAERRVTASVELSLRSLAGDLAA